MPAAMIYILIGISIIINIIILIVLISRKNGSSESEELKKIALENNQIIATKSVLLEQQIAGGSKQVADEFQRSRLETNQYQKDMREETSKCLKDMSNQLGEMTKANFEQQRQMSETVSSSLREIRTNNTEQNERQNKIIENAITKLQESNEKKLDEMRATVDEKLTATLTTRLDSSFKTVSQQLENVYKSLGEMKELSTGVTDNVTSLNRILTNVKARGTWAEVQLEGILDQTIPNMYDKNVATKKGSSERVEFAVKLPSDENNDTFTYLPIDSKFPMEDYVRLCDAADRADPDALDKARKALEDRVKSEAKLITSYINVPDTTPFAIMYLATEGLYAEIASSRTGLPEKLQNDFHVMIAGPSTITALLNSLAMGFRSIAINKKANEVWKVLGAAKTQYDKFGILLVKAKKKIDEAGDTIDQAQDRNRLIQKNLRSVEQIDSGDADEILGLEESAGGENE